MNNSVLVVAEKPSVARDIAAVIGADKQSDGILCGNGYIVTSARGHLVRLKEPQEYDERYNKWDLSDLPIIPAFEFVPIENAADVLERLTRLMNDSKVTEIICATDAGREGECIFRYVYDYIGCTKPVKRLWISSLTAESIRNGFANLRPSEDYDNMYAAGITRAKIDWLWGMNLTRLYTKHFGAICSIGRVQTAIVNMIASRDNEIEHFTKKPYFKLKLDNGAEWFDESSDYFTTRSEAECVKSKCENQPCKVISVKSNRKKENRPLLFSLTSLQVEANDKLGFSAATTLTVMQSLYEKKFLTYPRTDSNYLTDDSYDTADTNSTRSGIILPLKNMVNEAYALDIGKKIRSAAHQAMLDGDFIGARAPFGYRKSPDNCHKLIVDEETAPIVRQIFEWAASGIGINTITVRLNEIGAVTSSVYKSRTSEVEKRYKQNRNWTTFTVAHILDNPVYTGDMVQGKSKTIEHKQQDAPPEEYIIVRDTHEAIVSRELFETANKIRSAVREEYRNKPINAYSENIFKGLVFCPHCGKPLHRQRGKIRKDGTGIYRFHCISPSRVSKAACIGVNINEQEVIDFVSDALKTELSALKKSIPQAEKSDSLKLRKSDKQRELNRVQSLIRGLYENLVSGIISSEDYAEFKNGYAAKVSDLKAEIDAINSEIEQLETQRKQAAEARDCAKLFRESKALSADLLNSLVERIEISHDHEINIIFRGKESR